ncbi:MAG: helix-turn-helix domain-containing protein [Actinomycetota bacterium]
MRETQRVALRRFRERGFDAVRVEELADEVGIAASTIYRHFGTKEQLVLWDEHDGEIDAALGRRLGRQPPLSAICDAFVESLADRYEEDRDFQLDRLGYVFSTEQLHGAAVEGDYRARDELTAAVRASLPRRQRDAAPIVAGAALLALEVALDRWQSSGGATPLAECIVDAFSTLERLGAIG